MAIDLDPHSAQAKHYIASTIARLSASYPASSFSHLATCVTAEQNLAYVFVDDATIAAAFAS